jgi:putative ABC transport system permease protein
MEDREANQLGLSVGDILQFEILGEPVTATLVAIYGQRRYQARFWFEAIFSDGVLDPFITRHVGAARIDADGTRAVRTELARSAPTIVTVDIRSVLAEARALLGKAATGLVVIALVSLSASLLVLAGVVASARARQLREAVVLHVIGARLTVIQSALRLEYVLMALVASTVAAVLGITIAATILHYRLELPASGQWWLGALLALAAGAGALAAGARYIQKELKLSPAVHLRSLG